MARRQKDSLEELIDVLSDLPWWVSIVFGLIVYLVARYVFPAIWPDPKTIAGMLAGVISQLSWFSAIFVIPAVVSFFRSASKRRMLERQDGIESIRALPWKQFEQLLGEAYRRQGFTVFENPGKGADGGIDLTIKRGGEAYLVQCKHWKTYKVGVKVVREMLGLVTAHRATGAIVVTSGTFTNEAVAFAREQKVDLVDGNRLLAMVREVQTVARISTPAAAMTTAPAEAAETRVCPRCGKALVIRTATRGQNAGGNFYGCTGYPSCRHTEAVAG